MRTENAVLNFSEYALFFCIKMYPILLINRGDFMRTDILEQKEQILIWIEENQSKAFIARQLNCKQETLNNYLKKMGIEYSGNKSGKGTSKSKYKMPLVEYLQKSADIQSNKVRLRLLEEGYKDHKCECCGLETWLDKPIPLELHHKDGNRNNNTIENYELLCPNCHAFTDSYRGKNSRK